MKKIIFYAVALALAATMGCSKKEDAESQTTKMGKETKQPPSVPEIKEVKKEASVIPPAFASSMKATKANVLGDLELSLDDIKKKAAAFDQKGLMSYVEKYKAVYTEKKDQLAGITEKVKGLSMSDVLGEKGKALKNEVAKYTSQLSGLKDRYGVYLDMLKKYGVDLSSYGL